MLRGKVEREMALLSEGSSVKESPEDKQASTPCVRGSTLMWGGPYFLQKQGWCQDFQVGQNILLHQTSWMGRSFSNPR